MEKRLIPVVILGLFGMGCQQSDEKKSIEEVQDQVMIVHDEVMPRTGELMDLKEKVSTQIDSLSRITPASSNLKNRQEEGILINKNLTEADSLMSDWMYQYNADTLKGMDNTQAKAYLDQELQKINVVKDKISTGIDQAKKYLSNE